MPAFYVAIKCLNRSVCANSFYQRSYKITQEMVQMDIVVNSSYFLLQLGTFLKMKGSETTTN